MEFWAHINGNTYPVALGAVINDALGEELDSMDIRIPHVEDFSLKPYDDVYITDTDEYPTRPYNELFVPGNGNNATFYRHFLISNYQRQEINNEGFDRKRWFNFSISLISETKFLEKVLMPNRTITNPLNRTGKSVFWMANHFVDRYTPKNKLSFIENEWEYFNKIRVSSTLERFRYDSYLNERMLSTVEEEFKDVECQECSFNNPTLREVLTRIFQTRNFIPVVLDGVVFCRSLDRKGNHIDEIVGKTWDTQTMNGEEYVDRLRKNYSQGLTGDNGCVFHEYVGFRNTTSPTMLFGNLAIEVANPIYRINKFYLCYFSKWRNNQIVKCDMTSFVIPNSTRAFLSNDFLTYQRSKPTTINGYYMGKDKNEYVLGACDYRFNTVGYDIGSTKITGWGEQISYTLNGVTYEKKTTLENMLNLAINEAQGINGDSDVIFEDDHQTEYFSTYHFSKPIIEYKTDDIIAPSVEEDPPAWLEVARGISDLFGEEDAIFGNDTLKMKTVFFEIEYQGMVSSTVMVSKNLHDGDITAIDNQHESMALTESDGLVSQTKANRLGNKACVVNARLSYGQTPIAIGDYDEDHGICYKRTVSYEKDFMAVTYYFCQDYVLMNYYTSVNSRYKSSAYASIEQSVGRNEANNVQMLLSKSSRFTKAEQSDFSFSIAIDDAISILKNKDDISNDMAFFTLKSPKQGIFEFNEYNESELEQQYFATDRAMYLSGNSMCMTMSMPDSETAGTYIKQWYPDIKDDSLSMLRQWKYLQESIVADGDEKALREVSKAYSLYAKNGSPYNDISGTLQDYYSLPAKRYDGSLSNMDFYFLFGSGSLDSLYDDIGVTENDIKRYYTGNDSDMLGIQYQPKLLSSFSRNAISQNEVCFRRNEPYKDAKEVIGQTFQIEPISENDEIKITPWLAKLSDIYNKKIQRVAENTLIDSDVFIATTDQFAVKWKGDHSYKTHSIGFYTSPNDYKGDQFRKLVGRNIEKIIYFDVVGAYSQASGSPKFHMTVHRIMEMAADSSYLKLLVSMDSGRVEKVVNGRRYRLHKDNFEIVLWNESAIDQTMINRMNNPQTNGNYYSINQSYWNYYDDVFRARYGPEGEEPQEQDIHLESTPYRTCFTFNFDAFPVGSTQEEYNSNWEITSTTTTTQIYGFDLSDPPAYYGVMGSASFKCYDMVVPTDDPEAQTFPDSETVGGTGPRSSICYKISQYNGVTKSKNILWFYSEEEPSNIRKTYINMESLNEDGFFLLNDADNHHSIINESLKLFTYYGAVPIGSMTNPQMRAQYAKMRYMNCFYRDDNGEYHLIISIKKDEQNWPDYVDFISEQIVVKASFYVSFLYDRSKTVYDSGTMRPDYEIDNVAGMVTDTPTCHHK